MSIPLLDGILADLAIDAPTDIALTGSWPLVLPSQLAVEECAVAAVAACLVAAADLAQARGGRRPQ